MRRRRAETLIAIAIAAAGIGCNSGDAHRPPAPKRCAAELTDWTRAALAEGPGHRAANPLLETERPPRPIPPAPVVRLAPGLIVVGDEPIAADAGDLHAALVRALTVTGSAPAEPADSEPARTPPPPPPAAAELRIAAHPATPWSSLAAVSRAALAGGVTRLHLLVAAKSALDAPPPPDAAGLARCEPASALAGDPGVDLERLAAELPAAVESCGCDAADRDAARALVWQRLDRYRGAPVAAHTIELGPGGSPLVLDADLPWSEAERSVARLIGTVILGVAE